MKKLITFSLMAILFLAAGMVSADEPTYGSADLDGDYSEWNLTSDFFSDVYRAGDPTKMDIFILQNLQDGIF